MRALVGRWAPPVAGLLVVAALDGATVARLLRHASLPGDRVGVVAAVIALDLGQAAALAALCAGVVWGLGRIRGWQRVGAPEVGAAYGWLLGLLALEFLPMLEEPWQARLTVSVAVGLAVLVGRRRHGWVALAAAALALGGLRLSRVDASPPAARSAVNPHAPTVVLVTLDTFRADHLGAIGGYARTVETPNLDALSRRGALFTDGVAPVPLTLPSHGGMLTGRPPDEIGLLHNGAVLDEAVMTVTERFAAAGFRTGAFVSAVVLRDTAGLDRGFEIYDDRVSLVDRLLDGLPGVMWRRLEPSRKKPLQRRGDRTVRRALRWLSAEPGAAFLWVHLYDPHAPYTPPQPWDRHYDAESPDAPGNPAEVKASRAMRPDRNLFSIDMVGTDLRKLVAAYAGEVSWTDQVVGALLEGLPDGASLVVAGDHGESLTEHGYLLKHGSELYEPSVRVPIIVVAPDHVAAGVVVRTPVPLTDVAATLLSLGGLPADGPGLVEQVPHADTAEFALSQPEEAPSAAAGDPTHDRVDMPDDPPFEIRSFAPAQESRRALGFKKHWRVSYRTGPDKWIVSDDGRVERYDLASDPGELTDLAEEGGETVDAVRARGLAELQALEEKTHDATPDQAELLEALGYVTD